VRKHPIVAGGGAGIASSAAFPRVVSSPPPADTAVTAAVQPLLERLHTASRLEDDKAVRAWDLYETPEVRLAARTYSNAFSSCRLLVARYSAEPGADPEPILEPSTPAENKAFELMQSFAGGPEGQLELLDRMGTYFTVAGDMVLCGAYDPARMADSPLARWDVYSTSEIRWDGQRIHIRRSEADRWDLQPEWLRHIRVWNRHPRRGWEPDSPVRGAIEVLEQIKLYDARLTADSLSRLIGAGVWLIPQGMKLPTSTGDAAGGTPQDFMRLLMDVAAIAIRDRRSAAAALPIMVEASAEDIQAAKDGHMTFTTPYDERIGELREADIRRWATGIDLPAEVLLGMSTATHWNASLIDESQVRQFIKPSLRRACGNLTIGWQRPALAEFNMSDPSLCVWFDASQLQTRVETDDSSKDLFDRFLIGPEPVLRENVMAKGASPTDDELKRMALLHLMRQRPEYAGICLRELGIENNVPDPPRYKGDSPDPEQAGGPHGGEADAAPKPTGDGRQGPQLAQAFDRVPAGPARPGRTARLDTRGK
jgi:hypothetical protein